MADSSVPITPGAGASVDTRTAANGDQRQVVVPGGDGDYVGGVTPYGYLRINQDASGLFYDGFNGGTLDITDRWSVSGTAPVVGAGNMTMSTTASTNNALWSKPVLPMQSGMYINVNCVVTLETVAATGAGRFFGLGTPAASPSSTALVTDGAGWEVDAATGAVYAVTYSGGVRTIQGTAAPGAVIGSTTVANFRDGNPHRFSMIYRQSRIYWYIDGFDQHIATVAYPALGSSQDLPMLVVRNNAGSYTGTPVLVLQALGAGDMSRNGVQLSDGTFNWRKAKIGANGDQVVSLSNPAAAAAGIFASINAYGGLRVSVEPTVVFFDPFDGALDTTNRWAVAGTTPTVVGGTTSVNAGTVASATSRLNSQPTFSSPGLGFEILATVVQVEAAPVVNVYRFWGFASEPTTPAYQGAAAATSTAVTDAVGFELDTAGNLYCVVYSGGANTYRSAAISPTVWRDGTPHRYAIFKRSDIVFFYVEGQDVPVASVAYRPPATQTLGIKYGAYNNTTAPTAYTFAVSAVGVQDSTSQNQTISDAAYPWRRATVSAGGAITTRDFLEGTGARTIFTAQVVGGALSATEGLATLTPYRNGVAGTGATALTVTAGRTMHIQSLSINVTGSATAAATAAVARLRYSPTGTGVTATSPIAEQVTATLAAVASNRGGAQVSFGADGLELPSGYTFGISIVGIASGTYDLSLKGYEYV